MAPNLTKTITWIDKTEGRDKFCKCIQYASRFLMWAFLNNNKQVSERFKGLFVGMRDARKLFRLFKSLNEYAKIRNMLNKAEEDELTFYLNVLSRVGYLLYWVFDNINVLAGVKFLNADAKKAGKNAALCWFFGLLTSLIVYIRDLIKISHELVQLEKSMAGAKEEELQSKKTALKGLKEKRFGAILNLLKTLGDMITAGQGSEIAPKILKINFNDGWIGFGGLLSAVITSYQLY